MPYISKLSSKLLGYWIPHLEQTTIEQIIDSYETTRIYYRQNSMNYFKQANLCVLIQIANDTYYQSLPNIEEQSCDLQKLPHIIRAANHPIAHSSAGEMHGPGNAAWEIPALDYLFLEMAFNWLETSNPIQDSPSVLYQENMADTFNERTAHIVARATQESQRVNQLILAINGEIGSSFSARGAARTENRVMLIESDIKPLEYYQEVQRYNLMNAVYNALQLRSRAARLKCRNILINLAEEAGMPHYFALDGEMEIRTEQMYDLGKDAHRLIVDFVEQLRYLSMLTQPELDAGKRTTLPPLKSQDCPIFTMEQIWQDFERPDNTPSALDIRNIYAFHLDVRFSPEDPQDYLQTIFGDNIPSLRVAIRSYIENNIGKTLAGNLSLDQDITSAEAFRIWDQLKEEWKKEKISRGESVSKSLSLKDRDVKDLTPAEQLFFTTWQQSRS